MKSDNLVWQPLSVTRNDRERQNGHGGRVIWFTGLSGAGKTTIANALEMRLQAEGKHTYLLDGDNVRHGLNRDLGFAAADRTAEPGTKHTPRLALTLPRNGRNQYQAI